MQKDFSTVYYLGVQDWAADNADAAAALHWWRGNVAAPATPVATKCDW